MLAKNHPPFFQREAGRINDAIDNRLDPPLGKGDRKPRFPILLWFRKYICRLKQVLQEDFRRLQPAVAADVPQGRIMKSPI